MKNSNNMETIKKVQNHMIRKVGSKDQLYRDLTNKNYGSNVYRRVERLVDGGWFLVYFSEIRTFLNRIGYTKAQLSKMSDDRVWKLYKHLLGRDGERFVRDYKKSKGL